MTAVEWLAEQIKEYDFAPITNTDEYAIVIPVWIFKDKLNQAKEMEKNNIAKAWDAGKHQYFSLGIPEIKFNNGEEYYDINYNETYKK
jgi:hypothetical protein